MKKSDYICLFLSIIINIGIILALTVFSKDTTQEILDAEQIKIGLVAVENDASTKFRGEKNVDAKKQNLDADSIEKKEEKTEKPEKPTEKKVEEIKTEKTVEKITEKPEKKVAEKPKEKTPEKPKEKKVEKEKPVEKKVEKLAEKGEKVVEKKDEKKAPEKTASEKTSTKENSKKSSSEKPSLADLKKQISGSQPKTSNGGYSPTADPDGEEVVDRVLQNVTYSNGLVSGSKMGNSSDGRVVDWNAKNKAPEFPQAAKSSGKHGKLKIKLKVDKMGNVLSFVIVEGSGVPEIDAAVERVVGTWRVKLMKNGKPVNGTFYLNYNFDFK
ncbi:energy transducer TonB [Fusobacterium pseudoperiodonticum]|uniref:Energy transducer TonB n=1 Tax=Fusobacterium pseudoperiodonticum TaxID=2663009 RepID=A0A2D3PQG3_9FUSO|nr:energy transducer TonB [Fusobacterium pseudoperiodonticum]ATV69871.1 energy transducer TonB [Fusobacterium pseudoperiodonticum]